MEAAVRRAVRIGDAWLIANATTLGVNPLIMRVRCPGPERERVLGSIRRLAEIFA